MITALADWHGAAASGFRGETEASVRTTAAPAR